MNPPIFHGPHTEETKKKISETMKSRGHRPPPMTEELREKIIELHKGNKYCLGHKFTEEHRRHLSEASIGKKLSEETKRKIGDANRGEECRFWKGGISFRRKNNERNDSAYQAWVILVKKRDNNTCRFKNAECLGYNIAHHILPWSKYPEERYNINNGITLCQYHHPLKRVDEQRLIPVFQKLVGSNKVSLETR